MSANNLPNFTINCLALPAAIIGGIQGVIWLIFSLISILYYNNAIEPSAALDTNSYGYVIYQLYLESNNSSTIYEINSKSFNIFMYLYMVLSFVWLIISVALLWATLRKKWNNVIKLLVCWSTITIIISILDITMMSLLAVDLHKAQTSSTVPEVLTTTDSQTVCTAIAIVMSLAARGYVLLILNLTIAIILLTIVLHQKRQNTRPTMRRTIINAYANGLSSVYDQVEIDKSFQNEGFQSDEYIFGLRSNENNANGKNPLSNSNRSSIINAQTSYSYPFEKVEPLRLPSVQASRLAKIGKAGGAGGRNSPPRRVPSPTVPTTFNGYPYIPEPDYTPPPSPTFQPKSVLRPKSNYEL